MSWGSKECRDGKISKFYFYFSLLHARLDAEQASNIKVYTKTKTKKNLFPICKGPRKNLCSKVENFKNITTLLWSNITKNTSIHPKSIPARSIGSKYFHSWLTLKRLLIPPPPSGAEPEKPTPKQSSVNHLKNHNQGRILKAARDRWHLPYRGKIIRITRDPSPEIL